MTIIEVAGILSGAAFLLLVGYLIPVLIQVRKTVAEAERLLSNMNEELPPLIGKIQTMSQNAIEFTQHAKIGVEHASVFLHAVGEVGESVQRVHGFVKGSRGSILTKVASMVTGLIKGGNRRFPTSPKTLPLHAAVAIGERRSGGNS